MKQISIILFFSVLVVAGLFAGTVSAQERPALTQEHQDRIRANCVAAKESLRRIHVTDASLRVNYGQAFETISTKLLAPFNSRVALNRLDGTTLSSIATTYEKQVIEFGGVQQTYIVYENQVTRALETDCLSRPTDFYYEVQQAQQLRKNVYDKVKQIIQQLKNYRKEAILLQISEGR